MFKRDNKATAESIAQNEEHQRRHVEAALKAYRQGGVRGHDDVLKREAAKLAARHGLKP